MKRQINPILLERIQSIEWFRHCGEELCLNTSFSMRRVATWKQAERLINGQKWDDVQIDSRNSLAIYLETHFAEELKEWKTLVASADSFIVEEVYPKTKHFDTSMNLAYEIGRKIDWNILHAIMEDVYLDCHPPLFYLELLKIYEAGHMPCGWEHGDWPTGTLIVY